MLVKLENEIITVGCIHYITPSTHFTSCTSDFVQYCTRLRLGLTIVYIPVQLLNLQLTKLSELEVRLQLIQLYKAETYGNNQ